MSLSAEAMRAIRMNRIKAGLCATCGRAPATPGMVSCEACRAKDRAKYAHTAGKEFRGGKGMGAREPRIWAKLREDFAQDARR